LIADRPRGDKFSQQRTLSIALRSLNNTRD
jgi:hypothetical protein